jgi:hypothetical protein
VQKLRREHNNRRIDGGEDLDRWFSRPESIRGSTREETICTVRSGEKSRQPSDLARSEEVTTGFPRCKPRRLWTVGCSHRIPSAVGSGEDAQSLASGGAHKRMDLNRQILSRYPSAVGLDRSCTRFTIGTSAIGKSGVTRTRKSRHFKSRNTGKIWTVR